MYNYVNQIHVVPQQLVSDSWFSSLPATTTSLPLQNPSFYSLLYPEYPLTYHQYSLPYPEYPIQPPSSIETHSLFLPASIIAPTFVTDEKSISNQISSNNIHDDGQNTISQPLEPNPLEPQVPKLLIDQPIAAIKVSAPNKVRSPFAQKMLAAPNKLAPLEIIASAKKNASKPAFFANSQWILSRLFGILSKSSAYEVFDLMLERIVEKIFDKNVFIFDPGGSIFDTAGVSISCVSLDGRIIKLKKLRNCSLKEIGAQCPFVYSGITVSDVMLNDIGGPDGNSLLSLELSVDIHVMLSDAANCIDKFLLLKEKVPIRFNVFAVRSCYNAMDIDPHLSTLIANLSGALKFPELEENQYVIKCLRRVLKVATINDVVAKFCIEGLASILVEQTQNPTAIMITRTTVTQDDTCGDGTPSTIFFIGEPMKQFERYIDEGTHPRVLIDGFDIAKRATLEILEEFKTPIVMGDAPAKEILTMVARTTLRTKLYRALADQLTDIVINSVLCI